MRKFARFFVQSFLIQGKHLWSSVKIGLKFDQGCRDRLLIWIGGSNLVECVAAWQLAMANLVRRMVGATTGRGAVVATEILTRGLLSCRVLSTYVLRFHILVLDFARR